MICGHEKSFHTYEQPISSIGMSSSTCSSESGNVAIPFTREVIGSTNGAFRSNVSGVYHVIVVSTCMVRIGFLYVNCLVRNEYFLKLLS